MPFSNFFKFKLCFFHLIFLKSSKKFKSLLKKIKFDCLKFREFLILEIFFQNPFMLNNPPPPTNINLETSCPNLGRICPHPGRLCPHPGRLCPIHDVSPIVKLLRD